MLLARLKMEVFPEPLGADMINSLGLRNSMEQSLSIGIGNEMHWGLSLQSLD